MTGVGAEDGDAGRIEFTAGDGVLEVFDPIERHTLTLETSGAVDPTPYPTGEFAVPIDRAVAFRTEYLGLARQEPLFVRDTDGTLIAEVGTFEREEFPAGTYSVEFPTNLKMYARVEGPFELAVDIVGTHLECPAGREVTLGARSRHDRPAATVTTTADPTDVMAAVSSFGSALKTTSPERSFPSLRGHPPLVELGDELVVPEGLTPPETGTELVVPPDLGRVCAVAPLAYYLGATVVPGERAALRTDAGLAVPLDGPHGFETTVERTLKQVFFMDCLTRTEGFYDVDLHERAAIERTVDIDFGELYGSSPAERLEAYLDIPYAAVEAHLPEWEFSTRLEPDPDAVELLPFLVDDLSIVRTAPESDATAPAEQAAAVDDFLRDGEFTRSAGTTSGGGGPIDLQDPAPTAQAYHNRLDREPADGDIDITVVCNDAAMEEERDLVETAYGNREELPFDVSVHRNLSVADLEAVVTEPTDFLHYIGHIDDQGFECADGKLDAATVGETGVDAFFLNACTSYQQGRELIAAGSIGGVVTYQDVVNSGAVTVGSTLASLLNSGFALRAGVEIASQESVIGGQYAVVGDGEFSIAQPSDGTAVLYDITDEGGAFELSIVGYPSEHRGMGTVFTPHLRETDEFYLNSGEVANFSLSREELDSFLALLDSAPVRLDGTLYPDGNV